MSCLSIVNIKTEKYIYWVAVFSDYLYKFLEENKKLYIPITDKGGCYTCVTENSEGIAVANFILPPKHTGILQLIKLSKVSNIRIAVLVLF